MLIDIIKDYYAKRNLKWPDFHQALKFVHTELGEVYELDLSRDGGWVRNNPENKPEFNKDELAKELSDVVMMIIVAGIAEGVDVEQALKNKLNNKLQQLNLPIFQK
jgi:NTP pyrophosphatase (non-canonical NTP hydrolase)